MKKLLSLSFPLFNKFKPTIAPFIMGVMTFSLMLCGALIFATDYKPLYFLGWLIFAFVLYIVPAFFSWQEAIQSTDGNKNSSL